MNTKECEINNNAVFNSKKFKSFKFLSIIAESLGVFFKGRELMREQLKTTWLSNK